LTQSFEQITQVAEVPERLNTEECEEADSATKCSTTSTADTAEECQVLAEESAHSRRLKKIKDFLNSPAAALALGEEAVDEMLETVDEAQVLEALAGLQMPEGSEGTLSTTTASSAGASPKPNGSGRKTLSEKNYAEHAVALIQSHGTWVQCSRLPQPPRDAWTLETFVPPAIRRQDFTSSKDAWAAFDIEKGSPCVLRSPSGVEAAARSWVGPSSRLLPSGN